MAVVNFDTASDTTIVTLGRAEAVEFVALMISQLASTSLKGYGEGEMPVLYFADKHGELVSRNVFAVDHSASHDVFTAIETLMKNNGLKGEDFVLVDGDEEETASDRVLAAVDERALAEEAAVARKAKRARKKGRFTGRR
jgi:hypothetical protein